MANLEFSIPYNGDDEALGKILKLKELSGNRIREIFLSGPQDYCGSGRKKNKISLPQFINIVEKIHGEGIKVNLVLNSICEGSDWYSPQVVNQVMKYLEEVHVRHKVEAVTIANPVYIREVRKHFPKLEICASVLRDIDSVRKALIFREAGADVITPDANINRDLRLLKEIKETAEVELKIMVNEGCLYRCPFRKFHFNYISHKSKESGTIESYSYNFPEECCSHVFEADHSQALKSGWIRPEDLVKYGEITHFFKVVGRETPTNRTLRTIKAYMEESWDGDIFDIMCSGLFNYSLRYGTYLDNKLLGGKGFFHRTSRCGHNCSSCNYCDEIVGEMLMLGWLTKEKYRDMGMLEEADEIERQEKEIEAQKNRDIKVL
jgi:collagenase-like PrtC family protease